MDTGIRVTMEHARAAKLAGAGVTCASGIRAWCERHGIDLHQVAAEGLPVEQVEAIDDAFAQRAAALARAEATHG
jgi:hypothetical protein